MTLPSELTILPKNNYKVISIDPDNLSILSSTQRWNEDIRSTPSFAHWHELFDSRSINVKNVLADRIRLKASLDQVEWTDAAETLWTFIQDLKFTHALMPLQWIHLCNKRSFMGTSFVEMFDRHNLQHMPAPFMDTAGKKDTPAIFLFHQDAYQCELQWNGKIYPKLVEHEGEKNPGLFISNAFSKP
jgi:hypothetical protein